MARLLQPRTEPNFLLTNDISPACGRDVRGEGNLFRLTPLFVALLLAYSAMQAQRAQAEDAFPDFARPNARPGTFSAEPKGATLDNRFDGNRLLISPEYSDQTGLSLGGTFKLGAGGERLEYDYFTGKPKNQSKNRFPIPSSRTMQSSMPKNSWRGCQKAPSSNKSCMLV